MPENVIQMSKVGKLLDEALSHHPDVVLVAYRGRSGNWMTAAGKDVDKFPWEEMIGIAEVLKTRVVDHYFEETELVEVPPADPRGT